MEVSKLPESCYQCPVGFMYRGCGREKVLTCDGRPNTCKLKLVNILLPDMREKVKEYISELDTEIDRCVDEAESILSEIGDYDEKPMPTNYIRLEERAKVLGEVKNDLQSRLEELI